VAGHCRQRAEVVELAALGVQQGPSEVEPGVREGPGLEEVPRPRSVGVVVVLAGVGEQGAQYYNVVAVAVAALVVVAVVVVDRY